MSTPDDRIPTDSELDALQAEIERAKDEVSQRKPGTKSRSRMGAKPDMQAAVDALKASGDIPPESVPGSGDAERVAELETELAALKDRALRAMADADNTKKRAEREVANAKTYGVERIARDVLEVFDNLQRALASVDDTAKSELGPNATALLDGIELTEKTLIAVLSRHGIRPVPGEGEKFDPNIHQAVAQVPSDHPKGTVTEVMQHGFTLGDRTLRAAMVAVSAG